MAAPGRLAGPALGELAQGTLGTTLVTLRSFAASGIGTALHRLYRQRAPGKNLVPSYEWPLLWQYALAFTLISATIWARWLFDEELGDRVPFLFFFSALLPLVLLVRPGPFFLAAAIGFLGAWLMFIPPRMSFAVAGGQEGALIGVFGLTLAAAGATAWLSHRTREARARDRQALADSARHLGLLTNALPALISYIDVDVRYRYNNDAYKRWFGKSSEELYGVHLREALGESAFTQIEPFIRAVLGGNPVEYETEVPYLHGGSRFVHGHYVPDVRPDGSIPGFYALITDITQRKRLEDEVRQRSAQFETLLKAAPMGVYVIDADFRVRQVNAAAEARFSGGADALIGRDYGEIARQMWPPKFADTMVSTVRSVLETGQPIHMPERGELRADRNMMEYYERDFDQIAMHDGRPGVVCYVRDVSEQVAIRHAIARSEAKYRALFESMDEGFCILQVLFDENGRACDYRYLETNPAFEKQTGLADAVGRTVRELVPDIEPFWFEIYGGVALSGEAVRFVDHAISMGRWFDVDAFRIGPPEERHVAVLFNDITERKKAEAALREADRKKDEFLATLAHELRNPLAAIRMSTSALSALPDPIRRLPELASIIDRQSSQLVRLIDDLLDVSRIARGTMTLRRERMDLVGIVRQVVDDSQALCRDVDLEQRIEADAEPLYIEADPARITQVINNLLQNACDFTPPGGTIVASVSRHQDEAVVRVRDTGAGIPAEHLDRIFEMFAQLDHPPHRRRDGLGIGLSLAKWIVEMHGGSIRASSMGVGQGSEFIISLPIADRDQAASPSAEGPAHQAMPQGAIGRRLLVADDNGDVLQALALMLRLRGYDVTMAIDGADALDKARANPPEVALLDIGMPGMDGYEVARRIRREPWGKDMVLVALTGWGRERDREQAQNAGFDVHLTKPVAIDVLDQVLAERIGVADETEI
jgi:PAS domain S-box-containing protein